MLIQLGKIVALLVLIGWLLTGFAVWIELYFLGAWVWRSTGSTFVTFIAVSVGLYLCYRYLRLVLYIARYVARKSGIACRA